MAWEYSEVLNDWVYTHHGKLHGIVIILTGTYLAIAKEKIGYFDDLDQAKKAAEEKVASANLSCQ